MKKLTIGIVSAVLSLAVCAFAVDVLSWEVISLSQTADTADVKQIPAASGTPVISSFNAVGTNSVSLTIYRFDRKSKATAAATGSTNVTVDATSVGYIGGALPTTSDVMLIASTVSGTGTQYRAISSVYMTNSTVKLGFAVATSWGNDDTVFIAVDGKKQLFPITATQVTAARDISAGYDGYPMTVNTPVNAGATYSGVIEYRR